MTYQEDPEKLKTFTRETQTLWDTKAEYWDELMGEEGNKFYSMLVRPAAEKLLEVKPGERVLDVACGNGVFARRLARLGARVVATDYSPKLLERARARDSQDSIEYRLVDATEEAQLLALGERSFDAAVCNMALMDMTAIEPLLTGLARLLKPEGRFVFTTQHPCFNFSGVTLLLEQSDRDGVVEDSYSVKITDYLKEMAQKGAGAIGEPNPHYYFHRPLHVLLGSCFKAGFVLDGLEEPAFDAPGASNRPFSWANFRLIPPVLAARLRLFTHL